MSTANRPHRGPCLYCGSQTEAKNRLHRACRAELEQVPLPPGRWVPNGRGTVVFRATDGRPVERLDVA